MFVIKSELGTGNSDFENAEGCPLGTLIIREMLWNLHYKYSGAEVLRLPHIAANECGRIEYYCDILVVGSPLAITEFACDRALSLINNPSLIKSPSLINSPSASG